MSLEPNAKEAVGIDIPIEAYVIVMIEQGSLVCNATGIPDIRSEPPSDLDTKRMKVQKVSFVLILEDD